MTNELSVFEGGAVATMSSKFQPLMEQGLIGNELGEGIRQSYGILSIKGSKWRIKFKGEETPLINQTTGDPIPSLELVIVKANAFLNKQYYKGNYAEGSNSPPDCYSLDGKVPSPNVQKPVHTNCAGCPMNAFGSKTSDSGVKQKACRDTKKLAIVPLADLKNAHFGGPMLFRVPPSSLRDLAAFSETMKSRGYPYNSVAVRVGFDMQASHPKPTFKAIRPLTDDEAEQVLEHFSSDAVERILTDAEAAPADEVLPVAAADADFEQPPQAAPAPAPTPAPRPAAAPPKPAAQNAAPNPFAATAPAPAAAAPPTTVRVPRPAKPKPTAAAPAATQVPNPFGAAAPAAAPQAPAGEEDVPPSASELDEDINNILAGLNLTPGQ